MATSPEDFPRPIRRAREQPDDRTLRALHERAAGLRRQSRELRSTLRAQIGALHESHALLVGGVPGSPLPPRASARSADEQLRARFGLTPRELEVARLLAEGRRNSAIAQALGISPHTARHHTQHVLAKLGAHSRAEAGARLRR